MAESARFIITLILMLVIILQLFGIIAQLDKLIPEDDDE